MHEAMPMTSVVCTRGRTSTQYRPRHLLRLRDGRACHGKGHIAGRRRLEKRTYAASFCTLGSKARRIVVAVFWMRSQDALIPAMAWSPPPAQVAT
jgi:hypothetical protein